MLLLQQCSCSSSSTTSLLRSPSTWGTRVKVATMVEEVEEETTTFLPEQREVPFGFIYSKEFRVRVCYKANVINVCNYQNIMSK